jgi:FkbH-like protein
MARSVLDLPWLPAPPADFTEQCRSLSTAAAAGPALQFLAGFSLSPRQSLGFARALARAQAADSDLSPLSAFRLGVLSSNTFDLLLDCLPTAAARYGVALDLVSTPYNQVMQQALDPGSAINTAGLDAVLLAVDHRWLNLDRLSLGGAHRDVVASAIARLTDVVEAIRANSGAPVIVQTLATPPQALFGSFERLVPGSVRSMIAAVNAALPDLVERTGGYLLDTASLAERVGADAWFDDVQWVAYKLPFSSECFPAYADTVGRLLGAIRGKARKCLVLDLDNTVWGGVIGDDGVEGIQIGENHPKGEAFLSVQRLALDLRSRGIILAVSSKNTHETALEPFRSHPDMLLREEHIAVFQANWQDKASNLEAIAKVLNIGLDALVLLDDNPAERAQLRAALPMVATPELPNDPSSFAWYLDAAGYFEAVAFTPEDLGRAEAYAAEARRGEVMSHARDLGDYLSSLDMEIEFADFDHQGRQRITQLINKTNQFNLTTRRYTEEEVRRLEGAPDAVTLQVRLKDKFGDLGMIGVIICRPEDDAPDQWEIDTWLMSCRVLGRQVENAMLNALVERVAAKGGRSLLGRYRRSAKNAMVADHYTKLGFTSVSETADESVFSLALDEHTPLSLPMREATPAAEIA